VVVIDPGHPSDYAPGDARQNGTTEVHVNWVVAKRLEALLRERGYDVRMTKTSEAQVVANAERARIANDADADLLLRLHCDAGSSSGYAVYAPDRPGTAQGRTGPSPAVIERSTAAARALHAGMAPLLEGRLRDGGIRGDSRTYVGERQGALTGSIFSRVPVVLVEMVTLSDAGDAAFISTDAGVDRMARALAAGDGRAVPRDVPR
jgi:N-acetylmuramoyl-L-alanine amidase